MRSDWAELSALGTSAARKAPCNLVVVQSTDSTNRLARRLVEELAADHLEVTPTAVVSYEQTSGRGRRGKEWASPAGLGVWGTVVYPFSGEHRLERLPLAVASRLAEAVETGPLAGRCRLKWPNDLVVDGRKLGGILIEVLSEPSRVALIGFGINLETEGLDQGLAERATGLREEGVEAEHRATTRKLVEAVLAACREVESGAEVVERYRRRSVHREGDTLEVELDGERREARFLGISDEGFLRVEVDGEERTIASGEIFSS